MTAGAGPDPARRAALTVAVVYPDLLGTYGDGGNGLVLARRASWRGIDARLLQADSGAPLPTADIYCLGGGEDGPQVRAAEALVADGALHERWTGVRWSSGSAPGTSCSATPSPTVPIAPITAWASWTWSPAKGRVGGPSGSWWRRPRPGRPGCPVGSCCPDSPGSRTTAG